MPNIQILINTESLSEYLIKVNTEEFNSLFRDCCPLCEGEDCPTPHGTYTREVVNEKGTYYKDFPIARFLCNRKGKKKPIHKTFSLLPAELIPYQKYSLRFVINVLEKLYSNSASSKEILDFIACLGRNDIIVTSVSTINKFKNYIISAIEKLLITGSYPKINKLINIADKNLRIKNFIELIRGKFDGKTRDPPEFAYKFYQLSKDCKTDGIFLFGIPSQERIKT